MIEESKELYCPRCGDIPLIRILLDPEYWQCENCESAWSASELLREIRDAAQAQAPRPEVNFL